MTGLGSTSLNGIKIYNLASGKTFPEWLSEKKKKSLSKDEEYTRRVELVQDFHFPTASNKIKMSLDNNYIVATGTYPPIVKVYDVRDLSMKFERRLNSDIINFEILSNDYGKIAFLQTNRTISIHAPYGNHYNLRIPLFGRDMIYHREKCDLYISASSAELYRLNLDEGRFMKSYMTNCNTGINVLELNPVHQLLGIGGENGTVEMWDPRSNGQMGWIDIQKSLALTDSSLLDSLPTLEISSLAFDMDGLTFGVGTSTGHCLLYDLRSSKPLYIKTHQYGLPIHSIHFFHGCMIHTKNDNDLGNINRNQNVKVITADKKVVKIWEKNTGNIFTNIETPVDSNGLHVLKNGLNNNDTGILLLPGEQSRVMGYYIPELGYAPNWCSFLDSITEELEEKKKTSTNVDGTHVMEIYEDYKFVTRDELINNLNLEHLIGTSLLKAYMHGFFINAKLYSKIKATVEPMEYDKWKKDKIKEKLKDKVKERIVYKKELPKVNQNIAKKILENELKKKNKRVLNHNSDKENISKNDKDSNKNDKEHIESNLLNDKRFSKMFSSKDFQIDETSEIYRQLHPNADKIAINKNKMDVDREEEDENENENEEEIESEIEGKCSDEESSDYDTDQDITSNVSNNNTKNNNKTTTNRTFKFTESTSENDINNKSILLYNKNIKDKEEIKRKNRLRNNIPLSQRIYSEKQKSFEKSKFRSSEGKVVREMSFMPNSDNKNRSRNNNNNSNNNNNMDRKSSDINKNKNKRSIKELRLNNPINKRTYSKK